MAETTLNRLGENPHGLNFYFTQGHSYSFSFTKKDSLGTPVDISDKKYYLKIFDKPNNPSVKIIIDGVNTNPYGGVFTFFISESNTSLLVPSRSITCAKDGSFCFGKATIVEEDISTGDSRDIARGSVYVYFGVEE